jgi:hypothetical protein
MIDHWELVIDRIASLVIAESTGKGMTARVCIIVPDLTGSTRIIESLIIK